MPLSDPTSLYLTDLARRRAQAEALRQTETGAAQMGIGVLDKKQAQDTAAAKEAADQAFRLRQITDQEQQHADAVEQAKQTYRLNLSNNNATALRSNLEHFDTQRNADAERAIRLRQIADTEGETKRVAERQTAADARTAKASALSTAVMAASGGSGFVDGDAIAKIAAATGATPDEVKAVALEAQQAAADKKRMADKDAEAARHDKALEAVPYAEMRSREKIAGMNAAAKAEAPSAGAAKQAEHVAHIATAASTAEELAKLYEGGGITGGMMGAVAEKLPGEMQGDDRLKAHQLVTDLALQVPSILSGNNRLNRVEFEEAMKTIVGDVGSTKSNKQKAMIARHLVKMLQDAGEDAAGTSGAAPAPTSGGSDLVVISDGKETLQIPRARLAEAQADGFREVR